MGKARDLANLGSNTAALATDAEVTSAVAPKANTADVIANSLVDAKGDLLTATADNTPARIAVGTNGQVLQADSTTATGLKWATVSSTPTMNEQIFTSSGTFTVPTGITKVWVTAVGGGGAGGGSSGASSFGNGGSGGVLKNEQVTVTPGGSVTVTIGAGGTGVGGGTGNSGGQTSFGSLTAAGGAGGKKNFGASESLTGVNGGGNGGGVGGDANAGGGAAAANTGAGGGGAGRDQFASQLAGGAGGSGVVVVRWIS